MKTEIVCDQCNEHFEYDETDKMMSYFKPGKYYVVCPKCKKNNILI